MSVANVPTDLINEQTAAQLLGVKRHTLAVWRWRGGDSTPPYYRIGRRTVRYSRQDIAAWIQQIGGKETK